MVGQADHFSLAKDFLYRVFNGATRLFVNNVEDEIHRFAASVVDSPSGERLCNGVHEGNGSIHVGGNYRVADAGKSCRKPLFTLLQALLGKLALSECTEKEHKDGNEERSTHQVSGDDYSRGPVQRMSHFHGAKSTDAVFFALHVRKK